MKKWVVWLIIFMLILPVTFVSLAQSTNHPSSFIKGPTLYVGGTGPNNYTKIQDAIDDATAGDTVFVYDDSSPYYERLQLNKSISLLGEEQHSTIIDGGAIEGAPVLNISVDGVVVQGFTIQNSSATGWLDDDAGIIIIADDVTITDNIIRYHHTGVQVGGWILNNTFAANRCTIENNEITENKDCGIYLMYGNKTTVSHNRISANTNGGICFASYSNSNLIMLNQITNNDGWGILLNYGTNNTIYQNNITGNRGGVYILDSHENTIRQNNIYRNRFSNALIDSEVFTAVLTRTRPLKNTWDENYWGRARHFPKPILVYSLFLFPSIILSMILQLHSFRTGSFIIIPLGVFLVKFDWHPAPEPYKEDNGIQ